MREFRCEKFYFCLDMKERVEKIACWKYDLPDGFKVWAGKTDRDNDLLSLKQAAPNDWWFHVKGCSGSHVILFHPSECSASSEIIKIAAGIAAWHSKARKAGVVRVCYTQAKYVSKPRGAKAGLVQIKREKSVKVRPTLYKGE